MKFISIALSLALLLSQTCWGEDLLIANFEQTGFGDWQATGNAFGRGPVTGSQPDQPFISGFLDRRFANSYHAGVQSKGTLTSPPFVIERDYINFLIGGGHHPGNRTTRNPKHFWGNEVCLNLLIDPGSYPYTAKQLNEGQQRLAMKDGQFISLRTNTGFGVETDGQLRLQWDTLDVRSLKGKTAKIRLVDNCSDTEGFLCVDQITQSDRPARDLLHNADYLRRANTNVRHFEQSAPARRGFHFRSTVFGVGGPTCVYHEGYYHLFYIYNPFGNLKPVFPHNSWRHARSKDLVHWEDLDVVVWPSKDNGDYYCASGVAVIGDDGVPRIFYTSRSSERPMDQMAARGNSDLTHWRKYSNNPVIINVPENPMTHGTDCGIFQYAGKWYMVLGGLINVEGEYKGCFSLHASEDLESWKFVGVPYVAETKGWEEPDMFRLGDKWVVTFEPFGPTQYYTGNFDWNTHTFTPEVHSFVDFVGAEKHNPKTDGHAEYSGNFYGCTPFRDKDGRLLYLGLAPGGLSFPRVLSLRPDGKLGQRPVETLAKLRQEHHAISDLSLESTSHLIRELGGDMLEIKLEFVPGSARAFGIRIRQTADGQKSLPIRWDGERLVVGEERIPADLMQGETSLRLHILVDQQIVEIFANDWVVYTKQLVGTWGEEIELFSQGGRTHLKRFDAWRIRSIWETPRDK
ncbi:MAG: glycoside hydrolase family 32 protein [Pirellulaceae bacterium]|nr:glycoside hydrolase family 32 protein [Pirellulaceae bacterium]